MKYSRDSRHLIHRSKMKNRKMKRAERIVTFVMWLWSGDGLVFLSPLALSDNSPGRHGRRRARSSRRHACCRRGQFSLNYELDLRLQPRLGDDVVNFPEAFALEGPPVPRDHLVTWNSRREYPRNRRASDSFLRMFHEMEMGHAIVTGRRALNVFEAESTGNIRKVTRARFSRCDSRKIPLHCHRMPNIIYFSRSFRQIGFLSFSFPRNFIEWLDIYIYMYVWQLIIEIAISLKT